MAKKRKLDTKDSKLQKSLPVEVVVVEDITSHPLCLHGPTVLFSSDKGRYYACSLCRNKKDCTIHIDEEDWAKESVRQRNEKYFNLIQNIDKKAAWKNYNEVKSRFSSDRAYCETCQELYIISKSRKHNKDHRVITPLGDEQLNHPSSWLPTLENDAVEAQYIFSKKTIGTILGILQNNKISNIICIGTPSIHEAAQGNPVFDSILLDYDKRHHLFHAPNKYIRFNMFNNYMFEGDEDEKTLKKFIKKSKVGGLCVVMDPPFGGRVEPLAYTLEKLGAVYRNVCEKPESDILPVMWAFPYFSEPYITNLMPGMKMHDYQIDYENHKKFQNGKSGRKHGSPVRFYTNLPMHTIDLSNDKSYKYCEKCKYWVSVTNRHCDKCRACTGKNGTGYKHCNLCRRCVKPTFFHCPTCERCCLQKGHVCGTLVESQSCYICREKGHKKSACPQQSGNKKRKITKK